MLSSTQGLSGNDLLNSITQKAVAFMSGLAAKYGWEWQQLQEAQSRRLREKAIENSSESLEEFIEYFDAELKAKDEQIQNLKELLEIARFDKSNATEQVGGIIKSGLQTRIGSELYDGEFSDRLRHYLERSLKQNVEADARTTKMVENLIRNTSYSGRAIHLVNQIKSACKDGNEMPKNLGRLLTGFGFSKSRDGKHQKFEPPTEMFGVKTVVLPTTPSDSQRGGKNQASDVIKNFGLRDLK